MRLSVCGCWHRAGPRLHGGLHGSAVVGRSRCVSASVSGHPPPFACRLARADGVAQAFLPRLGRMLRRTFVSGGQTPEVRAE